MNIGLNPQLVCTQLRYKSSSVLVTSDPSFDSISSDKSKIFGARFTPWSSQWAKRLSVIKWLIITWYLLLEKWELETHWTWANYRHSMSIHKEYCVLTLGPNWYILCRDIVWHCKVSCLAHLVVAFLKLPPVELSVAHTFHGNFGDSGLRFVFLACYFY